MRKLIFFIMLITFSAIGCAPAGSDSPNDSILEEQYPPSDEPGSDSMSDEAAEKLRKSFIEMNYSENQERDIMAQYSTVDPDKIVPANLLKKVVLFYHTNIDRIKNDNYITVIDFSSRSSEDRLFLINMKTGAIETNQVAHGKGSDSDNDGYATRFKNDSGSHASSLGYYLTAETYYGGHGRSMKLDGISNTNSSARRRSVVVHGADYVKENGSKIGRSWGCPALSNQVKDAYIDRTKDGSLMYIGRSKVD